MAKKDISQNKADYLFINGFEVSAQVGDTPEERAFPQILTLNIYIYLDLQEAGKTDALSDSVDYARIIADIKKTVAKKQFVLIEAAAETIANCALAFKKVEAVQVHAAKKVFPEIESVGASVYRKRS